MKVAVRRLLGNGGIPADRTAAGVWLSRNAVPTIKGRSRGGICELVELSDLPGPVRLAFLHREADRLGLAPGIYDDAAHKTYLQAPPKARERAERRAAVARFLCSLPASTTWADRLSAVRASFPDEAVSKASILRLQRAVEGVDPINFAPALLTAHRGSSRRSAMSDDAWRCFLTIMTDAAADFTLRQAWRDVRDIAKARSWSWPSYATCYRRWRALPPSQQLPIRLGHADAVKRMTLPIQRDKTTIAPLEWVSLDGRTQDYWVHENGGPAFRPTMLALVDVASNKVLGWSLVRAETAVETVRLIRRACREHGIFERLYTDNGSAFAGHLVAGGTVHRFRNAGSKRNGVQPLGICHHMGIRLHFALPGNGRAKIAERTFATLSRVIDDRPEFKGAHAGHAPGATPARDMRPIDLDAARTIVAREIARHNAEPRRRNQGARGRSYDQVFADGLTGRIIRKPTERQDYLAGLIYKPVAVDRNGQVHVDTWTYGSPMTYDALFPFHGTGRRILLGRDPDDFARPALAFDEDGRLICDCIPAVARGAYDSRDGQAEAARNRKSASKAVAAGKEATALLSGAEMAAALACLNDAVGEAARPSGTVTGGHFSTQLRPTRPTRTKDAVPEEYYRNLDAALSALRAKGDKLA